MLISVQSKVQSDSVLQDLHIQFPSNQLEIQESIDMGIIPTSPVREMSPILPPNFNSSPPIAINPVHEIQDSIQVESERFNVTYQITELNVNCLD